MFLTLGFKSVTMDDIAAELAISKKTIYQHYATKPELIEAVTLQLFDNISCGIDKICDLEKNAIEELFYIKDFMLKNLKDETTSPIYQLQKYFPKVYSILRSKQFGKMHDCVLGNLQKGVAEGLYRDDLDPAFITRIYFIGGTGIKNTEIFPKSVFSNKDLTEKFLDYHLRAIASAKGLALLSDLMSNQNQSPTK